MKQIPIIHTVQLADGTILQKIVGATLPGSKKLQFPFDIPKVETSNAVTIPPETSKILITVVSILALGMVGSAILKRSNK